MDYSGKGDPFAWRRSMSINQRKRKGHRPKTLVRVQSGVELHAARKDPENGKVTGISHRSSFRMARGKRVFLEPQGEQTVQPQFRLPNDRLSPAIWIERNHSRELKLHRPDSFAARWVFVEITPTKTRRSIGYVCEFDARVAHEMGRIVWLYE